MKSAPHAFPRVYFLEPRRHYLPDYARNWQQNKKGVWALVDCKFADRKTKNEKLRRIRPPPYGACRMSLGAIAAFPLVAGKATSRPRLDTNVVFGNGVNGFPEASPGLSRIASGRYSYSDRVLANT